MRRLILGTAGHIDHGKTALVRALTGVDTDRLKEEKARGITIELGFAQLEVSDALHFGVVDVPGHEGFVRAMVAGATGMDVVLLVVAADEGVMPQTREHLAIIRLLGAPRLAVALTKCDLVEEAWLELVRDEVRELLAPTPYAEAPIVATSAENGSGLTALVETLRQMGEAVGERDSHDVARLPIDRVFTVRGTGTVITGTLWSGTLRKGQRIHVEPAGPEARIRAIQVHGQEHGTVQAGTRTAVALAGADVGRDTIRRGQCLVTEWPPSSMLTVEATVLPDTGWQLEHGQRIRVHAGTAEALARAVVPSRVIPPGRSDWVQLRLEEPVVARARDRLVLRSYSPVTTMGGAVVAEPHPAKRSRFQNDEILRLDTLIRGGPAAALEAALEQAGWSGLATELIPLRAGLRTDDSRAATTAVEAKGGLLAAGVLFAPTTVRRAEQILEDAVQAHHEAEPLQPGIPLELLRQSLPAAAPPQLADAILERLERLGRLDVGSGRASAPDFEVVLAPDARSARERLREVYREQGIRAPTVRDLPRDLTAREDFDGLLQLMVEAGELTVLDQDLYAWTEAVKDVVEEIEDHFGGRSGLSPADFREVVPVTRKHLMPLLGYLDGIGVTVREGDARTVRGGVSA